jgi:quinol monooxygenase YgiN
MVVILVQHNVKDYPAWKKVFDSAIEMRKSNGEISAEVYRDESDPNKLTIFNKWDSMANAQKFIQSPDLMKTMENAGVMGMPAVSFLNQA